MYKASSFAEAKFLETTKDMTTEELSKLLQEAEQESKPQQPKSKLKIINTVKNKKEIDDYINFVKENTTRITLFPIDVLPNKLNIIIAPSNAGKSAYLQNISVHASLEGKKVLYITAEQDDKEIGRKFRNKETALVNKEDYEGVSIMYLESGTEKELTKVMQLIKEEQFDVICYDYIKFSTLITNKESYLAISMLTNMFYSHIVISSPKTVFFAAIQANTTGQSADLNTIIDKWPSLVDGGGGATRHADNVLWLKREQGYSKLIICKLRDDSEYHVGDTFDLEYIPESETYRDEITAQLLPKPKKTEVANIKASDF